MERLVGGRKLSPETIKKMSEARKGKTFEEIYGDKAKNMKNNLRIKLTGQHYQTEESKERIGEAALERWQDEEYRKKCILEISNAFSAERKEEQSERMLGDKNPNYINGKGNFPYAFEFNEKFKNFIRERDNHTCQLCGRTKEEEGQNLAVHHIYYDKENSDMAPERFITLCNSCNNKVNSNRKSWTKLFESKLELRTEVPVQEK